MATQTAPLNEAQRKADREAPASAMVRGVGELGGDIVALAELQAQLAVEDLRSAIERLARPIIITIVGGVIAIAALPVLLIGIAETIVEHTDITRWGAYLIVSLVTLALGAVIATVASRRMFAGFSAFERSKQELANNLQWLKLIWSGPSRGNRNDASRERSNLN